MKEKKIFDIRIELTPTDLAVAVILVLAVIAFIVGFVIEAIT